MYASHSAHAKSSPGSRRSCVATTLFRIILKNTPSRLMRQSIRLVFTDIPSTLPRLNFVYSAYCIVHKAGYFLETKYSTIYTMATALSPIAPLIATSRIYDENWLRLAVMRIGSNQSMGLVIVWNCESGHLKTVSQANHTSRILKQRNAALYQQ